MIAVKELLSVKSFELNMGGAEAALI